MQFNECIELKSVAKLALDGLFFLSHCYFKTKKNFAMDVAEFKIRVNRLLYLQHLYEIELKRKFIETNKNL